MGLLEHFVSQLYRIATKAEIFFFFLSKTKKNILIEEKIQEKEKIQKKEKKAREG